MNIGRHQLWAVGLVAGFLAGCPVEHSPNPEHCFHAGGDLTCAARFGATLPYCVGPGEGCPTAEYGCVAEVPEPDCYSPCGDSALASDDATCLEVADESGEPEPAPECGDGVVDDGEACDDGNDIDDDECSNACEAATCGDGITQIVIGETCDDGNTQSGDACAWNCTLPGTEIWSRTYADHACEEAAIAVTTTGELYVALDCEDERRLLHLDADGEIVWEQTTPLDSYGAPNLAISGDEGVTVGGRIGTQGHARHYDADGNLQWSHNTPLASSAIHALTSDASGSVIAAGFGGGAVYFVHYHHTANGLVVWSQYDLPGTGVIALSSAPSDAVWSLQTGPLRVEKALEDGTVDWATLLSSDQVADLAVDPDENTYVIGNTDATGTDDYQVHKLDATGTQTWLRRHDDVGVVEVARAVAVLPGGGALVVGHVQPDGVNDTDGMLNWFMSNGTNLLDVIYDGPTDGDLDELVDVAVSADGHAIAVGHRDSGSGTKQLWLLKVAI